MMAKVVSLSFLTLGALLILYVLTPLVSFKIWELGQKYNDIPLLSPKTKNMPVEGISIRSQDNFPSFVSSKKRPIPPTYKEFNLTIPKLGINSQVFVESNDLALGLIHLPGSSLPGEKGNVFVSGHSALSRIFGKGAIFANLTKLKKGDSILVEAEGVGFIYRVINIKVVDPNDLSVIKPPDEQGRYISLMTCVPPGLNTRRLVVLGELI